VRWCDRVRRSRNSTSPCCIRWPPAFVDEFHGWGTPLGPSSKAVRAPPGCGRVSSTQTWMDKARRGGLVRLGRGAVPNQRWASQPAVAVVRNVDVVMPLHRGGASFAIEREQRKPCRRSPRTSSTSSSGNGSVPLPAAAGRPARPVAAGCTRSAPTRSQNRPAQVDGRGAGGVELLKTRASQGGIARDPPCKGQHFQP